jgi:hypothetical protein
MEVGGMGETLSLETHVGLSKARSMLSRLIDRVAGGNLLVIERRGRDESVALVDAEAMEWVLARAFPFSPEVYFDGESGVAIWLPELGVGAEGDDLDSAEQGLIAAVLDYVASWEEDLRKAPNHANALGWVYRIQLAEHPKRIRDLIFEDREAPDLRPAPSLL